jgi:hypothetical protein
MLNRSSKETKLKQKTSSVSSSLKDRGYVNRKKSSREGNVVVVVKVVLPSLLSPFPHLMITISNGFS